LTIACTFWIVRIRNVRSRQSTVFAVWWKPVHSLRPCSSSSASFWAAVGSGRAGDGRVGLLPKLCDGVDDAAGVLRDERDDFRAGVDAVLLNVRRDARVLGRRDAGEGRGLEVERAVFLEQRDGTAGGARALILRWRSQYSAQLGANFR
jgi:hypothetical protein